MTREEFGRSDQHSDAIDHCRNPSARERFKGGCLWNRNALRLCMEHQGSGQRMFAALFCTHGEGQKLLFRKWTDRMD